MKRISCVVAARPNFMKIAPVISALGGLAEYELIHSGQHYDYLMSDAFFEDLGLPEPDVHLGVGSGTHAEQTAGVMVAVEKHLLSSKPDILVVVGDVNATLGSSLAAAKLGVPVAHVEAGLRSFDRTMPEELNRVIVDRIAAILFTPSPEANENLLAEGIDPTTIALVGNVMIDTMVRLLPTARSRHAALALEYSLPDRYALVTLHRASNVDDPPKLASILEGVRRVSEEIPVLFPIHPRTRARLATTPIDLGNRVMSLAPLGYLDFLALMQGSSVVLTDSGGIQEETSVLGIPCITVRDNTERPITIARGTNRVAGTTPDGILGATRYALAREWGPAEIPLWDGKAAQRIAAILCD